MTPPAAARAVYVHAEPDPIFALLHAPPVAPRATAVLIVPPWGWEEIASHRSLRAWAQHLAGAGYVTLRFDLPSCGDSGGSPRDPARVEAWVAAIVAVADWLRAESGCARVAVLGLGLGGLVAARAIADGARIEDFVLWGAPVRGRAFVRGQTAFSRLQASRVAPADADERTPAQSPEDGLEAGGFVLSQDTMDALHGIDLRALSPAKLRRALLLERDGAAVDDGLRTSLQEAGVDVTCDTGDGWEAMTFHPERPQPPQDVFERVAAWLAAAPDAAGASTARLQPPAASGEALFAAHGVRVRESWLAISGLAGLLVGVLAEPVTVPAAQLCAVFLNAGAVRRVGPNRLWVEAARRWAARGVPALRVDLQGIGDADGDADRYRDVTKFYVPMLVDEVGAVLDDLQARGIGDRFLLVGLCSGGYWAFQAAVRDERVSAAVLVNSGALVWDDDLVIQREARKVARLRKLEWWRRIARGDVAAARMRAIARAYAQRPNGRRSRRGVVGSARVEMSIDRGLERLHDSSTRLVLAFSGDEPLEAELEEGGVVARLDRWPDIELVRLPGGDHTLRPLVAQRALHELVDRELARELARLAGRRGGDDEALRAPRRG